MLGVLKTLFRASSKRVQDEHTQAIMERSKGLPIGLTPEDIGGLCLGGMVKLDLLGVRGERFVFDATWGGEDKRIEAIGVVELGDGEQLVRCYLENDTWIQVSLRNKEVIEYKIFDFWHVEHLSDGEFGALVNQDDNAPSRIGRKTLEVTPANAGAAVAYDRVWGMSTSEWTPPTILKERVTRLNSTETTEMFHHCMLFERSIEGTERFEYVLLSAEVDEADGSYQLVTNLGVDLHSVDITTH